MRFISLFLCSAFLAGCAGHREISVTRLPRPGFYSGSVVPLSPHADIDGSVSKAEVEYFQKRLAGERDGGDSTIDSIHKKSGADGDIFTIYRSYYFWEFKHTASGEWLMVSHGEWFS
jgi:hypothetical protein